MMPGWRCLRIAMSEWSWDAPGDSMERTCARAVEMGLPAVAFTEHADDTTWKVVASDFAGHEQLTALVTPDGTLTPPRLDLDGYLECVQRCRDQFPNLRVISGVELGEAHRHSRCRCKVAGCRTVRPGARVLAHSAGWPTILRVGHWRSTRRCRFPRRSFAGGGKKAAKQSHLEATHTTRLCWRAASRRRRPWLRLTGSDQAVIPLTSGHVRADLAEEDEIALPRTRSHLGCIRGVKSGVLCFCPTRPNSSKMLSAMEATEPR